MTRECKHGYHDCQAGEDKCFLCSAGMNYVEPKKRYPSKRKQKADKRMGSGFEAANHDRNQALIQSNMTLNSGATWKEKGDENIVIAGFRLMEELKTQEATRAKGCKSFAIKREWLNKLHVEAKQKGFDAWHLKFAFNEDEGAACTRDEKFSKGNPAGSVFVVLEEGVIMAMIQRLAQCEIKLDGVDSQMDFAKKKSQRLEAENVALKARIDELEAENKMLRPSEKARMLGKKLEEMVG